MSKILHIEFDWLNCDTGSELDRALAASIGVAVGEEYLTRLDDLVSKTVRNQILASASDLAYWFAGNWWRLRWEPAPGRWWSDADWRMAHCLAASGGGYVWPNAIFASDGDSLEIIAKPKSKAAPFEPVRYINDIQAWVTAEEFEQKVDAFMEGVISRIRSLRLMDESLPRLWDEILKERGSSEMTQQRKLEAMAGFDPDQAPAELLEKLLKDQSTLGKSALAEVAAESRHKTGDALKVIRELAQPRSKPKTGGFRLHVPSLQMPTIGDGDNRPWRMGALLADIARNQWGLGKKPIDNRKLAELLSISATAFSSKSTAETPMPLGIRMGTNGTLDIYFDRPSQTTRRFAASRLLGDSLYFSNQQRLLPVTHAKTSRQKFQRSFAQEFLCPIDALREKIGAKQPNEDDISEAATYFHVSPLLVRTTLVNHGQLDREALSWVG
jgi:hypothetical protein